MRDANVRRAASQEMLAALEKLSARYCWDGKPEDAAREASRVMLRTMNVGTWEDILDLERMAGRDLLAEVLAEASAGAMTPSAWSFWHYRLRLTGLDDNPPPPPTRAVP